MSYSPRLVIIAAPLLISWSQGFSQDQNRPAELNRPYVITRQPKAVYTDRARKKGIEGSVTLKITLLADGQVGTVSVERTKGWKEMQKYGLTDNAINAAKQIQFSPKVENGRAVPVRIIREYTFSLY
jgi:protein TonB